MVHHTRRRPHPGPVNPEIDEEVWPDPAPRIIRPKERNVRPRSNMGYLSGQNPGGYCSRLTSPSAIWGSRFVGACDVGP